VSKISPLYFYVYSSKSKLAAALYSGGSKVAASLYIEKSKLSAIYSNIAVSQVAPLYYTTKGRKYLVRKKLAAALYSGKSKHPAIIYM
jgi:hypothetical protein